MSNQASRRTSLAACRLFALVACGLALATCPLVTRAREIADPDPARFAEEIRAFEAWDRKNAFPEDSILFVGSSSIRLWHTAESFPQLRVINRGFGGSHISDVAHFADRIVFKYRPREIVFYAGDNDIAAGKQPAQVAGDFREFMETVRERLPTARIYYLPIKPSLARWSMWPQMQQTNATIERLAHSDGRFDYVDIATPMLGDDSQPRPDLFLDDGLHLNSKGYALWNQTLRPALGNFHGQ